MFHLLQRPKKGLLQTVAFPFRVFPFAAILVYFVSKSVWQPFRSTRSGSDGFDIFAFQLVQGFTICSVALFCVALFEFAAKRGRRGLLDCALAGLSLAAAWFCIRTLVRA